MQPLYNTTGSNYNLTICEKAVAAWDPLSICLIERRSRARGSIQLCASNRSARKGIDLKSRGTRKRQLRFVILWRTLLLPSSWYQVGGRSTLSRAPRGNHWPQANSKHVDRRSKDWERKSGQRIRAFSTPALERTWPLKPSSAIGRKAQQLQVYATIRSLHTILVHYIFISLYWTNRYVLKCLKF